MNEDRVHKVRLLIGILGLAAVLAAVGCGSSAKPVVSGKVSYKGQPLPGGSVTFHGASDWIGSCRLNESGAYTIENVPEGRVQITVETTSARPPRLPPGVMPKASKDAPIPKGSPFDTSEQARRFVPIPERYADKNKSGLTYEVKSGKQEHNINLD